MILLHTDIEHNAEVSNLSAPPCLIFYVASLPRMALTPTPVLATGTEAVPLLLQCLLRLLVPAALLAIDWARSACIEAKRMLRGVLTVWC